MHKTLIGLAAAAGLGLATVAAPAPANAYCVGCAVGAGVLGGVVAGAIVGNAIANSPPPPPPPGYYPPPGCILSAAPTGLWSRLCATRAWLLLGQAQSMDRGCRLPMAHRPNLPVITAALTASL